MLRELEEQYQISEKISRKEIAIKIKKILNTETNSIDESIINNNSIMNLESVIKKIDQIDLNPTKKMATN